MANKEKQTKNQRHFLKDFKAELKKVIWPTPKQLTNNTLAVIVIVAITTLVVFVLDLTFSFLNDNVLNKFKETIKGNDIVIEQNTTLENDVTTEPTENTENTQLTENVENVTE